ncbi:hypothetical protein X759_21260 [Mesorhizobium sp. LSHC420B00]|nr:hypothetical protein X759_21260 [Mesorhizobium sp. LSHC420B00]
MVSEILMGVQASKGHAIGARDFFCECWCQGRDVQGA